MPTYNLNSKLHLYDEPSRDVGLISDTYALTSQLNLRDDIAIVVDNAAGDVWAELHSQLHLNDDFTRDISLIGSTYALLSQLHLREDFNRLAQGGEVRNIASRLHIYDEIPPLITVERLPPGDNISYGETEKLEYEEFSHRIRWTNYDGMTVPDLNYKDLTEPIIAIIAAPSFLQFEYANSFLVFTRNTINRFILQSDIEPGLWREQTDNLIREFKDLGLMEPKSLVLAADTLFGLSEKGVWMWNKDGMKLISDKIITIPDAGIYDYVGFYCSIRNQYILHRQESAGLLYVMTHGTPQILPGYGPEACIGAWKNETSMIDGTRYIQYAFYDSNSAYLVIGTVDIENQTVAFGGAEPSYGSPNFGAHQDVLAMSDTRALATYDKSGQPRRMFVIQYSGNNIGGQVGLQDITGGSYLGGFLLKFSATRFTIFHNQTDYYVGTFDGVDSFSLHGVQTNWYGGIDIQWMRTLNIEDGKSIIGYWADGRHLYFQVVTDQGTGTMLFGNQLSTGITMSNNDRFDFVQASSDLFFCIVSTGTDLIIFPIRMNGTNLSYGYMREYAGYCDADNGVKEVGIANKGQGGFWAFWEHAGKGGHLYGAWGTGSSDSCVLWQDTFEQLIPDESEDFEVNVVPGGYAVITYMDGIVVALHEAFGQVWGSYAAAVDSFVYQIDKKKWYKFLGLDILDKPVILSGGNLDENFNLWLNSHRLIQKYPGGSTTAVQAYIRTKEFYIKKGVFQRWMVDVVGTGTDVETRVRRVVGSSQSEYEDRKFAITPNKWRGISHSKQRGRTMSILIIDAEIISGLSFDVKLWGEQ